MRLQQTNTIPEGDGKARQQQSLTELYEPAELAEQLMTARDHEIRATGTTASHTIDTLHASLPLLIAMPTHHCIADQPERAQLAHGKRRAHTPLEYHDEALWIFHKAFSGPSRRISRWS